jgi:hypothetical protein
MPLRREKAAPRAGMIDAYSLPGYMKSSPLLTGKLALGCAAALGLTLTVDASAADEPPVAQAQEATNQDGMARFQLILQRNIFDSERGNRAPVSAPRRLPRVEMFSFRGAAEKTGMGYDAFFTGDGAPASGKLEVNDSINGFKVLEIALSEVKLLDANQKVVVLPVESGLSREDGGSWTKVLAPTVYRAGGQSRRSARSDNGPFSGTPNNPYADNSVAAGSDVETGRADTAASSSAVTSDVTARLRAQRAQEN